MKHLLSMVVTLAVLTGCLQSLYPMFSEADLLFDERLVGSWKGDGDEVWTFARATSGLFTHQSRNAYFLTVAERDSTVGRYVAGLGQIDGRAFLDLLPDSGQLDDAYAFLPLHVFYRVWIATDSLRVSGLEMKWVQQAAGVHGIAMPVAHVNDRTFLTAGTEAIQQFFKTCYRDDPEAFDSTAVLRRQ